ncbi:MAG: hypothetical protein HQK50_09355 [Oligoflexia bacterium]|nr:hypothetical protein [Oligoflexia bacterium]
MSIFSRIKNSIFSKPQAIDPSKYRFTPDKIEPALMNKDQLQRYNYQKFDENSLEKLPTRSFERTSIAPLQMRGAIQNHHSSLPQYQEREKSLMSKLNDLYASGSGPIEGSSVLKKSLENIDLQTEGMQKKLKDKLSADYKNMQNRMMMGGADAGALERLSNNFLRSSADASSDLYRKGLENKSAATIEDFQRSLQNKRDDKLQALGLEQTGLGRYADVLNTDVSGKNLLERLNADISGENTKAMNERALQDAELSNATNRMNVENAMKGDAYNTNLLNQTRMGEHEAQNKYGMLNADLLNNLLMGNTQAMNRANEMNAQNANNANASYMAALAQADAYNQNRRSLFQNILNAGIYQGAGKLFGKLF